MRSAIRNPSRCRRFGERADAMSTRHLVTRYGTSPQGWTLESADGAVEMEMTSPVSFGQSQSDYCLPAGSCYLSSNANECAWNLTVSEER